MLSMQAASLCWIAASHADTEGLHSTHRTSRRECNACLGEPRCLRPQTTPLSASICWLCTKLTALQAEKIEADPLLATGKVRARTANEILRAFAHVQRDGHLLWLPIYAHHGTADHLANIQVGSLFMNTSLLIIRGLIELASGSFKAGS